MEKHKAQTIGDQRECGRLRMGVVSLSRRQPWQMTPGTRLSYSPTRPRPTKTGCMSGVREEGAHLGSMAFTQI